MAVAPSIGVPGLDIFELVLFFAEFAPYFVAANVVLFTMAKPSLRLFTACLLPLAVAICVAGIIGTSYIHAKQQGYDLSQPTLRTAMETYIETGKGPSGETSPEDIYSAKKYPPVFGKYEVEFIPMLLGDSVLHFDAHNEEYMPVAYNKGNDFFRSTLGEPMVYTSGIYKNGDEDLMTAQMYKLDYVANAIGLKKGDKVLDIGCGWGTLVERFSVKYGAEVTGVTLSSEQVKFFEQNKVKNLPKGSKSKIMLQDAMKLLESPAFKGKKFDKITALEMAEHVGIRRYQEFLKIVKSLLKDDGVFYIQVAGLKRDWRYEDFVWGLFMGQHIFPGADASTPIGWVSTQLERAGWEVQRVNNLGSHYSRTLSQWCDEWRADKENMVKKYGVQTYRRWEVFLAWSTQIAYEGQSTVFMITTTKQNEHATRVETQKRIAPVW